MTIKAILSKKLNQVEEIPISEEIVENKPVTKRLTFHDLYQPELLTTVASYLPFTEGRKFLEVAALLYNNSGETYVKTFRAFLHLIKEISLDRVEPTPTLLEVIYSHQNIQRLSLTNVQKTSSIESWAPLELSNLTNFSLKGQEKFLLKGSNLSLFSTLPRTITHLEFERIDKTKTLPPLNLNQLKNLKTLKIHHSLLSYPDANIWLSDLISLSPKLENVKILGWNCNPGKNILKKLAFKSLEIHGAPWLGAKDLEAIFTKNSIETLSLKDCRNLHWTEVDKTVHFPSVISLYTNGNISSSELLSINRIFPNLTTLWIDGTISLYEQTTSPLYKFKNLEYLKLPNTRLPSEFRSKVEKSAKKNGHKLLIDSKSTPLFKYVDINSEKKSTNSLTYLMKSLKI